MMTGHDSLRLYRALADDGHDLVGLPLLVYALITGNVNPLYRAGVAAMVWTCRVAGMRMRVEGLENIPAANLPVRRQSHEQCRRARHRGLDSAAHRHSGQEIPLRHSHRGPGFRIAHFVPVDRANPNAPCEHRRSRQAHEKRRVFSYLSRRHAQRRTAACTGSAMALSCWPSRRASLSCPWPAAEPIACWRKSPIAFGRAKCWCAFVRRSIRADYSLDRRGELAERVHDALAAALPPDQQPAGYTRGPSCPLIHSLSAQNGCQYARIAATVNYRDDQEEASHRARKR